MADPLCTCTQDGCWCESDSTNLADDTLDTIKGGISERKQRLQAELDDVRRQRRELRGHKQISWEQAAELVRISERHAPNYSLVAPVAEKEEFEHFLPIVKPDPFAKKLLAMSDADES